MALAWRDISSAESVREERTEDSSRVEKAVSGRVLEVGLLLKCDRLPDGGDVVRDDPIDAHIEKAGGCFDVVNGVDPDAKAAVVGFFY